MCSLRDRNFYRIRIKVMYVNPFIVSSFMSQPDEEASRIERDKRACISLNFSISEAFYKYNVFVVIFKMINLS